MSARSTRNNALLWTAQILLALLFAFAGSMKFILPAAVLQQGPIHFPLGFIRFIGVAEILGALGLVLPGLFRVHRELTGLAAAGLVIIMIGATTITAMGGAWIGALFPLAVGVVAVMVCVGRGVPLRLDTARPRQLPDFRHA